MPLQRSPSKFIRSNMDRLRRSIRESFRRRSGSGSPSERNVAGGGGGSGNDGKPQLWSQDEATVRAGTCAYPVKYLGSVEVGESRGMQVCEEALKVLRAGRRRPVKGVLYVSGDGIRVVDSESKGLVVDQTIEKVSFCAPDRNHEKGFAYICRDGTTRRWMCHGFHASKDSGERLSHAVGCAFAVCLERKQKRDREAQQALNAQQLPRSRGSSNNGTPSHVSDSILSQTSTNDTAAFQRHSLFRQSTLSERLQDPQNAKPSEKPPVRPAFNPHAIARPAGNRHLFERQGSLRMAQVPLKEATAGTTVDGGQQDMFRRFNSLRINQLPSNLERVEQNVNVVGQSAIIEEETSHFPVNSTGGGNLNLYGAQCNSSYFSPPASEVGSPSSHTRSASFDTPLTNGQGAVTGGSSYPTVSTGAAANPVGFSRANGGANWAYCSGRLTGSEWLETAAKQAKLLQHQIPSSTPVPQLAQRPINNDKKTPSSIQNAPPPPSFAPPPLPRPVQHQSSVVGVPVTSRPPSLMTNSPARSLDLGSTQPVSTGGTDFDARWNALAGQQEPKVMEPVRNPFSQESTEVNI